MWSALCRVPQRERSQATSDERQTSCRKCWRERSKTTAYEQSPARMTGCWNWEKPEYSVWAVSSENNWLLKPLKRGKYDCNTSMKGKERVKINHHNSLSSFQFKWKWEDFTLILLHWVPQSGSTCSESFPGLQLCPPSTGCVHCSWDKCTLSLITWILAHHHSSYRYNVILLHAILTVHVIDCSTILFV